VEYAIELLGLGSPGDKDSKEFQEVIPGNTWREVRK
jgi:hypothetical protein